MATTEWNLISHYEIEGGLQTCSLASMKWEADKVLADNWDNYVRMVSKHEDVHRQYAIWMVSEYEKELV